MATNEIPGYVHPSGGVCNKSKMYKTFTEGQKPKKKEKFGTVDAGKSYARVGGEDDVGDICPVCKVGERSAIKTCNCVYGDKTCAEGHIWYTNRDGEVCVGNPHAK